MASPFEIFRKNQRLLMAFAVLIAMFAFVVAPMIQSFSGSGGQGRDNSANPTIASWNGGSIKKRQADRDEYDIQLANRFLSDLARAVLQKGGMPQVPGFNLDPSNPNLGSLGISPVLDERTAAFRRMLLTEAQNNGIHFDDKSVTVFLEKYVNGKLDGQEIQSILKKSTERQLTMVYFTRIMREELTYQHMLRLTNSGMLFEEVQNSRRVGAPVLTSPSKNWQEFLRLNREATIKAYPIYVKDQLAEVTATPSEKELKEIYNQGKSTIRTAGTPDATPAFMSPASADIEFMSIDIEALKLAEMAKIPEETLRKEYERGVAEKKYQVPIELPKQDTSELPGLPGKAGETGAENPATNPSEDGTKKEETNPPQPTTDSPQSPAAESPVPANEPPPATPAPTTPVPTEPPKSEPVPEEPPKNDTPAEPKKDGSLSLLSSDNKVQLVSYQEPPAQEPAPPTQEPAPPTQETQPATEAIKIGEAPTTTETPPTVPKNPLRDSEPKVTSESGQVPEMPSDAVKSEITTDQEAIATPIEPSLSLGDAKIPGSEKVPMRTKTFEEVKEEIASELARATAQSISKERLDQAMGVMNNYAAEFAGYQRAVEEKLRGFQKPERPNLQIIAKELGLDYGATGLIDSETIQMTPIGQSAVGQGLRGQAIPVPNYVAATQGQGAAFVPLRSSSGRMEFAFWKTRVDAPLVPSFEEAREQATQVWKVQQAIKLAESKAKELASRVGAGNLEDVLATEDEKKLVAAPAPFSAVDRMMMLWQLQGMNNVSDVSRIPPLREVDRGFMDTVFGAKPGETIFAPDKAKAVYYVVKVVQTSPSKELFEKFQRDPNPSARMMATRELQQTQSALFDAIEKRLGFRLY